ncbi:hypothetical protein BU23DRAFT_561105 [Bimuria novae-zelandiae CBS 107.79]|uniref:Uncharacterized protein n=1 Tax=Bimuria novae-zelandiae CBS 107.79 TaxID=1447943 RepID=A0A6A5UNE8_9PLEO|nr:hypothetical protein BU23DRAFT_561105 [Bimuria novae-zelandiae CBS 107.79]
MLNRATHFGVKVGNCFAQSRPLLPSSATGIIACALGRSHLFLTHINVTVAELPSRTSRRPIHPP